MRRALLLTFVAAAALAAPAHGRDEVDEDLQLWVLTSATLVLDAGPIKLAPYLELQPRFDDDVQDLEEVIVRGALLVRFGRGFWAGQGFLWSSLHEPSYFPEYRPYQEIGWRLPGSGITPSLRLRTEQRVLHNLDPVSHRVRVRPMLEVPLTKLGDVPLGLVLWDEVFVNLNDVEGGPREGYQQNRAFAGLSLRVLPQVEVQVGYLNQHRNHRGRTDEMGHTILVQAGITLE
jgi:hypothetical protein